MAEIVRAWGSEFPEDIYGDTAEYQAEDSARSAVEQRLRNARMTAIDDMEIKTVAPDGRYRCQASVRAVKR